MPKPREAKTPPTCSFCGQPKEAVPLLVVSNVTQSAVCTYCAMGVIEQTLRHAMGMEKLLRELVPPPKPEPDIPKIEIVPSGTKPDKVDVAIGKALNHGK